jgi:GT2 family glycosyltransferase
MSEAAPLVSVVVPAYEAERFIARTLASALGQTMEDLEVIVVDDGSRDATADIAAQMAGTDPRLVLLRQENAGVAAARDLGLSAARGRFVAMLDADDLWHPEKLARQLAVFAREGDRTDLVYCRYREIDEEDGVLRSEVRPVAVGDVYAALVLSNFAGGGSAALIRREALAAVGGFGEAAPDGLGAEDIALFLALAERGRFALADAFLLGYRRHTANMSGNGQKLSLTTRQVLARAERSHPELPPQLFRWASGESLVWLGTEALYDGRVREGVRFLARAGRVDPRAALSARTAHAGWIALRRYLGRGLGRNAKKPAVPGKAREVPLVPFAALAPEDGLDAAWPEDRLARRLRQAGGWRIAKDKAVRSPLPDIQVAQGLPDGSLRD